MNFKVVELVGENKELIIAKHPSLKDNKIYGIKDTRKGRVVTQIKNYIPLWFVTKEEAKEVKRKMESFSSGKVGLSRRDKKLMEELER